MTILGIVDIDHSSPRPVPSLRPSAVAKLKWNYVVEKIKEEKYQVDQKCSSCSCQLKAKSESLGSAVKSQAIVAMAGSEIKAKEAKLAIIQKSKKLNDKSQLLSETLKDKSNVLNVVMKDKSLHAGESIKLYTRDAGHSLKIKTSNAGEVVKGKTQIALNMVRSKAPQVDTLRKLDNTNDTKDNNKELGPDNSIADKITNDVAVKRKRFRKAKEIFRKKRHMAGQILAKIPNSLFHDRNN